MNYFKHEEGFKVCAIGPEFKAFYYTPYSHLMNMGIMNADSEWMQHLSAMHQEGVRHFGQFNMNDNPLSIIFLWSMINLLPTYDS